MTAGTRGFLGGAACEAERDAVEDAMVAYMEREAVEDGTPWSAIARHILGLRHGERGARLWRQVWSDHKRKPLPAAEVAAQARACLRADAPALAA
jgi:tRNA-dihydrouridine synthase A